MRKWWFVGAFVFGLLLIGLYWGWAHGRLFRSESKDYARAEAYLKASEPYEAEKIMAPYGDTLSQIRPKKWDWLPLFAEALVQTGDAPRLAILYRSYPRVVDQDERKALLIAAGLIAAHHFSDYKSLRAEWQAKRHNAAAWFALDADVLIAQRKREEAIAFLQSKAFDGPDDSSRLIRLALLTASTHLQDAWGFLEKAAVKDPKNSRIYSYRGQILEQLNRTSLARQEYLTAIEKNPKDPVLYDQLAEFYLRQGLPEKAFETWKTALELPGSAFIRLRILFWSRLITPYSINWADLPPVTGPLKPLIDFLASLPPSEPWNEELFNKIPNRQTFLKERQETFWLRLINALTHKEEDQALKILTHNPFQGQLWAPNLARALHQILSFRRYGVLQFEKGIDPFPIAKERPFHSFFHQLNEASAAQGVASKMGRDLEALVLSPYAFSAAFLAEGWLQAALDFNIPVALPNTLPPWLSYAYTQALRLTKGPLEALNFAILQSPSNPLTLLIGELMVATGSPDAASEQLKPLIEQEDEVGMRAAWIAALLSFSRERYAEAQEIVAQNAQLKETVEGKELLAKIALEQGDKQRAIQLYEEIEGGSFDAKYYLAQLAYQEKNYARAKALIEALLVDFPNNPQLLVEWEKIKTK